MTQWIPLIASAVLSILGGGLLGVWLTHRRLSPKSKAEAREITAAARDKDWARFQREIDRLVKRVEDAENRADRAEKKARECEEREIASKRDFAEREASLTARIVQLEAYKAVEGQARQEAAGVVALERLADKERSAAR